LDGFPDTTVSFLRHVGGSLYAVRASHRGEHLDDIEGALARRDQGDP